MPDGGEMPRQIPTPSQIGSWARLFTYKQARRVVVGVFGGTIMLFGVLLLVLPGPGILTMAAGLAILATEFAWARRWLRQVRGRVDPVVRFGTSWLGWRRRPVRNGAEKRS